MKITDEAVEAAARVLVPVWFGGFEDQSEEGFPGTPNRLAINTARASLEAALPHLTQGAGEKDGEPPTDAEAKARLAEIVAKNLEDFGPGTNPLGDTKDGPKVVAWRDPMGDLSCIKVSKRHEPLVRLSDYEALRAENERLRIELDMWRASSVSNHRHDQIVARNAELVKALNQIDALDPEEQLFGVSHDACRGLIARMGEIARAALGGLSNE